MLWAILALQEENLTLEEYIVFCLVLLYAMEKYLNYFRRFLLLFTKWDMFVGADLYFLNIIIFFSRRKLCFNTFYMQFEAGVSFHLSD